MQNVRRLLTDFIPAHYDVSLVINTTDETLTGTVAITGTSTDGRIALHAKDLDIDSVTIDGKSASWTQGVDDELTLTHPDLAAGEHVVVITYRHQINEYTRGIYASRYQQDGERHTMFVTQMEPDYARELLPCVDEPAAKATFAMHVSTDAGLTVLSNMPIAHTRKYDDGHQEVHFQTTPRMSSYLLALAIGDLHSVRGQTARGIDVGVWATTAQDLTHLEFALEHSIRAIEFYEEFFGVEYPLPKSDQLALPDISSGVAAMENGGLVTYREDSLVVDPQLTSIATRRRTAIVIAHELSHQWFGNLVTMDWWTYLWLNESFATVMEYVCVDALHPEWHVWREFASSEAVVSLRRDSLDGVQAVEVEVHHPDEIGTLFDGAIVYAKGARLVRMLMNYCGLEAFRRGLTDYFTRHAYRNTNGDDLWDALSAASGKPVKQFMHAWVSQPGYPVVSVSTQESSVRLSQEQFFVGPHEDRARIWPVPLDASDRNTPAILDTQTLEIDSPVRELRLNTDDAAHFITQYDEQSFSMLLSQVRTATMPVIGRIQLLHEHTLLARGGRISTAQLIDLLDAYADETDEHAWSIMGVAFAELKKFVEHDAAAEQRLRDFADRLARPLYTQLGLAPRKNEDEATTQLRATVLGFMAYGEHQDVIDAMTDAYTRDGMTGLNPEIRALIMSVVVRHSSDRMIFDALYTQYPQETGDIQGDIADALSSTRDAAELQRLIDTLTDTTIIRSQDTVGWYADLIRNRDGRAPTWRWCRDNWPWIMETFGEEMNADAFLRVAAMVVTSREMQREFKSFTEPLLADISLQRTIEVGLVDIEGRLDLLERDGDAVRDRLAKLD